jgi:hypothetical protein
MLSIETHRALQWPCGIKADSGATACAKLGFNPLEQGVSDAAALPVRSHCQSANVSLLRTDSA